MAGSKPSEATTEGIRVTVKPRYIAERSSPLHDNFFFAYDVEISNVGASPAQLVSRHWIITDGEGATEHVRGAGVVGEQPHLQPGESFRYQSFCPLKTPEGSMQGTFQMVRDDGTEFDADVALFALSAPRLLN